MDPELNRFYLNRSFLLSMPKSKLIWHKRYSYGAEFQVRNGTYTIYLSHYFKDSPSAYIVLPEIDMSRSLQIHTFGQKYITYYKKELPKICLHLPSASEWNSMMSFQDTFVPWAIEWTEFYEIWLLTGEWFGGGVHPLPQEQKSEENYLHENNK